MKKSEVKVGRTYAAKVSGRLVPVTLVRELTHYEYGSDRAQTRWDARNESTGRAIVIRSAQRLRFEVTRVDGRWKRAA